MHYQLLVRIKNAQMARKKMVRLPFSTMDLAIAKILADNGYLAGVRKKTTDKKNWLEIELPAKQTHHVMNFKLLSKPSRRLYVGYRSLKSVKQGYGLGVLSTPQGIMTNVEARKNKAGGEYLFEIW